MRGRAALLTNAHSVVRRTTYGRALDVEQLADPRQRLARDRRVGRDMNVVDAPHMCPAGNLGHYR